MRGSFVFVVVLLLGVESMARLEYKCELNGLGSDGWYVQKLTA